MRLVEEKIEVAGSARDHPDSTKNCQRREELDQLHVHLLVGEPRGLVEGQKPEVLGSPSNHPECAQCGEWHRQTDETLHIYLLEDRSSGEQSVNLAS